MSKRGAAIAVSQSLAFLASLNTKRSLRFTSPRHPGIGVLSDPSTSSRLCSFRRSCSSSRSAPEDDLSGLVDPEFAFPIEGGLPSRENHRVLSVSSNDFAFLHDGIADGDANSGRLSADVGYQLA